MKKPTLFVLSGLPCTGKSTLAENIAKRSQMPVFSVDPIESAILEAGLERSFETGLAGYLVACALADARLRLRQSAIVDAVNGVVYAKRMWQRLAARHDARLRIVECVCSNERLHRRRLTERHRGLKLREPTWDDVELRKTEWVPWTEPVLVVDATEPLRANVERVVSWLTRRSKR